jgi:hypothetical protein
LHRGIDFFFCESKKRDSSRETRQKKEFFGYYLPVLNFNVPILKAEIKRLSL